MSGNLALLLPTRWIGHYKTINSIIKYKNEILKTLTNFSEYTDADIIIIITGLLSSFDVTL